MKILTLKDPAAISMPIWIGSMGVGRHLSFWEGLIDIMTIKVNVSTLAANAIDKSFDTFQENLEQVGIANFSPYAIALALTDTKGGRAYLDRMLMIWLTPAALTSVLASLQINSAEVEEACTARGAFQFPLDKLASSDDILGRMLDEYAQSSGDTSLSEMIQHIRPNTDYFLKHSIVKVPSPSATSLPVSLHVVSWKLSTGELLATRSLQLEMLRPCYLPATAAGLSSDAAAGIIGVYKSAFLSFSAPSLTSDMTTHSSFVNLYSAVGQLTATSNPSQLRSAWALASGASRSEHVNVPTSVLTSVHNQLLAHKRNAQFEDTGAIAVLWYMHKGMTEVTGDASLLGAHRTNTVTRTVEGHAGTTIHQAARTVVDTTSSIISGAVDMVSSIFSGGSLTTGLAITGVAIGALLFGPRIADALRGTTGSKNGNDLKSGNKPDRSLYPWSRMGQRPDVRTMNTANVGLDVKGQDEPALPVSAKSETQRETAPENREPSWTGAPLRRTLVYDYIMED